MRIQRQIGVLAICGFLCQQAVAKVKDNKKLALRIPPEMYDPKTNKIKHDEMKEIKNTIEVSNKDKENIKPGDKFLMSDFPKIKVKPLTPSSTSESKHYSKMVTITKLYSKGEETSFNK